MIKFERLITYRVTINEAHVGWVTKHPHRGWYFLPRKQERADENTKYYISYDRCEEVVREFFDE